MRADNDASVLPSTDAPLMELRAISKQFPGVKALDDVSLDVRAGDVHMLLGEKINAANIPVVNITDRIASGKLVAYVGADDYNIDLATARHLLKAIVIEKTNYQGYETPVEQRQCPKVAEMVSH